MELQSGKGKRRLALAAALSVALVSVGFLGACGTESGGNAENKVEDIYYVGDAETPGESGGEETAGLVIPLSDFETTAKFYGVVVDDTYMEIIAVKYGSTYRTAFNTCQVCYGSPYAYFVQSGNNLICQNCYNRFSMAMVGITSGGCNPYPIGAADRIETDDEIIIPNDYLVTCTGIFRNWKAGLS